MKLRTAVLLSILTLLVGFWVGDHFGYAHGFDAGGIAGSEDCR